MQWYCQITVLFSQTCKLVPSVVASNQCTLLMIVASRCSFVFKMMRGHGSRGGKSYWTQYRQIRSATAARMEQVEEWLQEASSGNEIPPNQIPDNIGREENQHGRYDGSDQEMVDGRDVGIVQETDMTELVFLGSSDHGDEELVEQMPLDCENHEMLETDGAVGSEGIQACGQGDTGDVLGLEFDGSDMSSIDSWYSFDSLSSLNSNETNSQNEDPQSSDVETRFEISNELAAWGADFGISHAALRALLHILRGKYPELGLPKDPRTLLSTRRNYEIKRIAGGEYFHFGAVAGITVSILSEKQFFESDLVENIELQFNIDGLPLFKSANTQFWPILSRVVKPVVLSPFIVGLYVGAQKPIDINEYFEDFIDEMKLIELNGILIEALRKRLNVTVSCFICDAPARSFIKQVKGHTSYYSCERCTQRGEWQDKVTLPRVDAPLRTDASFDEMTDEDHHGPTPTPLRQLSIGLVSQVVLDPMHLVYLGVVRKLIRLWMKGSVGLGRISANSVTLISGLLVGLHGFIPREFPRKCRSLSEFDRWKATELRQFLLYSGIVVLKGNLPEDVYSHFLLLFVSVFCMSHPSLFMQYGEFSRQLLLKFVSEFSDHYGRNQLVYNVHNLVHLADDVQRHGTLDSFSAFSFESFLGKLKKMLRKAQSPLPQVIRRLSERKYKGEKKEQSGSLPPWNEHNNGPLPYEFEGCSQYSDITWKSLHFSVRDSDNCVQIGSKVCLIRNIIKSGDAIKLIFEPFCRVSDFFLPPVSPLPSSHLDIYKVSHLSRSIKAADISDITYKFVRLPYKNKKLTDRSVVIPLVHQFH